MDDRRATTLSREEHAFIGYKSKMRSCRLVRLPSGRLRCAMSWRFRLFGIAVGLLFGLLTPVLMGREHFNTPGGVPLLFWAIGGLVAGMGWLVLVRFLLFSRAIEIDGNAGTIEFVRRRGWRESREVVRMDQVRNVLVGKVMRLREEASPDNSWNRIECWLLKLLLTDGGFKILCETTDRSILEEMRSFIVERVSMASSDILQSAEH
jgi:hypothetical protein